MPRVVKAVAWDWTPDGALITVNVDGALVQWLVPIAHVHVQFGTEMTRVGCPLAPSVGAPSVGGLFGGISKAFKKATRAVKKAVPKAVRRAASSVSRAAERGVSSLYKGAKSYASDAANVAKRLGNPRQLGMAALTGGQSLFAQTKAQQHFLGAARHIPGQYGQAAQAALTGGNFLARVAQNKDPRLLQTATALGGQAFNRYAPGVANRLAPNVKKTLMGLTKVPGLPKTLPLPTGAQFANARRVWGAVNDAEAAAQRLRRGIATMQDRQLLSHGQQTLAGLRNVVHQARSGHQPALRALQSFRRVGGFL